MTDTSISKPLRSGQTIGILGGGQLGRMLAMAAARLDLKTVILDPSSDCPAAQVATRHICAAFDDKTALADLLAACETVTYEFENIPLETARFFEAGRKLFPGARALECSQDRLVEKNFLNSLGVATAPFIAVSSAAELQLAMAELASGGILKTRRFGYDGKGQARLQKGASRSDLDIAFASLNTTDCILEGFVDFGREISVIAGRGRNGEIACFDPAENVHREGILRTSTLPARINEATTREALEIATTIVSALEYVGVMGIEFFVHSDGSLLVNEIAPRVHNSGHWSEAACVISQFEQHVRAVAGWPLGNTKRHSDCVMENLVGNDMDLVPGLLAQNHVLLHLYGKSETRPGRKMGHFTRLLP
jgi:5-(carboxyamino)imidazole ribonucleotide synthase